MKIIDRYIIRQFMLNFLILLTVFALLFTLVNVTLNLDDFLDAGRRRAAEFPGGVAAATVWAIADYNFPMVLLLYVFFCGLLVVGAMGFTLSGLARTRELVAMVSSGLSMYRIAAPIVLAGAAISALSLPNQEFLIPQLAPKLSRSTSHAGSSTVKPFEVAFAADSKGNLFTASRFDAATQRLDELTILERSGGVATRRFTARAAVWEPNAPTGWHLEGGSALSRSSSVAPIVDPGERSATATDFFESDLSPQVLLAHKASLYTRLLSLRELEELANNRTIDTGQIRQIMHTRFSLAVMNVLVLVMGLPFFLLREPANMLVQGLKAAAVCMGAWGGGLVMLQIGSDLLNPVAAAWLPVVIYLPVSAILMMGLRT